ncbi:hypothetical protein B4901_02410 [Yersinia frederiksenii]|nr:hypothetical protein B4901_02410 [Yersinia frederiksenii]
MSVLSRIWRVGGLTVLLLAALSLIGWAIWHQGEMIGLDTTNKKVVVFLLVCLLGMALRFGPAFLRLVRQLMHRKKRSSKIFCQAAKSACSKHRPVMSRSLNYSKLCTIPMAASGPAKCASSCLPVVQLM